MRLSQSVVPTCMSSDCFTRCRALFAALIVWHRLFCCDVVVGWWLFHTKHVFAEFSHDVFWSDFKELFSGEAGVVVTGGHPIKELHQRDQCSLHWSSSVAFQCIAMVVFVFFVRKSLSKLVSSFVGCTRHMQRTWKSSGVFWISVQHMMRATHWNFKNAHNVWSVEVASNKIWTLCQES